MLNSTPGLVLVADDDENDVFFLKRAFRQAGLRCPIVDVPNGEEAIRYLSEGGSDHEHHPLPALLLLDLKMPLLDGFDVLSWLQKQPEFKEMPIVVLTSSGFESDIDRARKLGARDYLVKPRTPDDLVKLVQDISLHWLTAELPAS